MPNTAPVDRDGASAKFIESARASSKRATSGQTASAVPLQPHLRLGVTLAHSWRSSRPRSEKVSGTRARKMPNRQA